MLTFNGTSGLTFPDGTTQNTQALPGMRNRIINGDMRIDQRYSGTATPNTINGYTLDRWIVGQTTTGKLIAQYNAGSVTPPTGFTSYLGVTSQSAYSVLASDIYVIQQVVEGFNVTDLGWGTATASPITVSFYVRSSLTGTFGGAICNSTPNRSYPFTYTISSANTWEYKTITIPGDTSGVWAKDNTAGLRLYFGLGMGSTYSGTAGTWAAGNYRSATGSVSVVGTSGATFYITGVQLEKGSTATPFEYRPYGAELALCQRYYSQGQYQTGGVTTSGVGFYGLIKYTVPMRVAPTLVFSSLGIVGNFDNSLPSVSDVNNASEVSFNKTGTASGGGIYSFNWTATAEL